MPEPDAIAAVLRFRARLLRLDGAAATQLVRSYGAIWRSLEGEIEALAAEALTRELTFAEVERLARYKALQVQVTREVSRFAGVTSERITTVQRASVALAQSATRQTVNAALPRGISVDMLIRAGVNWNQLPAGAFEAFVGIAGDGGPLMRLLSPLGAEAAAGVRAGLAEGIALGQGPRETARLVRQRFGMPLTRALTISRTEILRSYREATRAQYAANPDVVKGYRRVSARDDRVCMACIALDGKLYQTDEPPQTHVACRCALVPETVSYRDLGLDVPDREPEPERARAWFERQPEATQRDMMGDAKFAAFQEGKFGFDDLVTIEHSETWGDSAVETPLKELIGA